jgi:SNF2 family DNA or RNA helicase
LVNHAPKVKLHFTFSKRLIRLFISLLFSKYTSIRDHKIALFADEVVMGKTIQSLAFISALLHEMPNPRILILPPRDEIAKIWEKEYQTFVRYHYRHHDNIINLSSG